MRKYSVLDYCAIFGFFLFILLAIFFHRIDGIDANLQARIYDVDRGGVHESVIATKGASIIFKELQRFKLYDMRIDYQHIRNPNPKLASHIINPTNGFKVNIMSNGGLEGRESLGNITYDAVLVLPGFLKFLLCYCAFYLCLKLLLDFSFLRNLVGYVHIHGCNFLRELFVFLSHVASSKRNIIFLFVICLIFVSLPCFNYLDFIIMRAGDTYGHYNDSSDMQWYPSVHYWGLHGFSPLNPYLEYLNGNVFLANAPNYGHLLYILMYPFALLTYDETKMPWAVFNTVCIFITLYFLFLTFKERLLYNAGKLASQETMRGITVLAGIFFLIFIYYFFHSHTYAKAIYRGNIPLVLCLFLTLAYLYRHNAIICGISLAIICVKYTFGVPLMLGFLLAGYFRAVFLAAFINLCAVAIFAYRFDMGFIEMLFLAPKVGSIAATSMVADFMSLAKATWGFNAKNPFVYAIIFCLIFWILAVYKCRPSTERIIFSSLVLSFCLFQHHVYDQVMIVPALMLALYAFRIMSVEFILLICFIASVLFASEWHFYSFSRIKATLFASMLYIYALYVVIAPSIKMAKMQK